MKPVCSIKLLTITEIITKLIETTKPFIIIIIIIIIFMYPR